VSALCEDHQLFLAALDYEAARQDLLVLLVD